MDVLVNVAGNEISRKGMKVQNRPTGRILSAFSSGEVETGGSKLADSLPDCFTALPFNTVYLLNVLSFWTRPEPNRTYITGRDSKLCVARHVTPHLLWLMSGTCIVLFYYILCLEYVLGHWKYGGTVKIEFHVRSCSRCWAKWAKLIRLHILFCRP